VKLRRNLTDQEKQVLRHHLAVIGVHLRLAGLSAMQVDGLTRPFLELLDEL
jgi:hypothetical protein